MTDRSFAQLVHFLPFLTTYGPPDPPCLASLDTIERKQNDPTKVFPRIYECASMCCRVRKPHDCNYRNRKTCSHIVNHLEIISRKITTQRNPLPPLALLARTEHEQRRISGYTNRLSPVNAGIPNQSGFRLATPELEGPFLQ